MPQIVLVTLVHNRKDFVGLALKSAVNQTLDKKYWIHFVIDNNSDDGADKVVELFSKKHSHIKFVRQSCNLGQQKAYNWALKEWLPNNYSDAEIMCILDSDDELMPNALEEVYNTFKAHPEIGGAYSGFSIIDKHGNIIVRDHGKAKMAPNQFSEEGQKTLRQYFLANNPCGHIRCYNIKCLKEIGGFDERRQFATDYSVFGNLLEKYYVVKINKVLYKFRQHKNQIQATRSPQQTNDWRELQKEFSEKWKKAGLA